MIYFVRHGETVFNATGKWNGFVDTTLTAKGAKQAVDLGRKIKDVKFDLVMCSPALRARQTCEMILASRPYELRPQVITDSRIMEWYSGDYEGYEWDKRFCDDFFGKRELYDFSSVESFKNVKERIHGFLDELRTKYKNKSILIVAHGGIGRVVNAYFNGMPSSGLYTDVHELVNCELIIFDKL
ncbi:MAG: histidine phosphatase family protein [Firmicutes bacterium]|nr:histidine phosphatase family protein [Bacillota bacterium]